MGQKDDRCRDGASSSSSLRMNAQPSASTVANVSSVCTPGSSRDFEDNPLHLPPLYLMMMEVQQQEVAAVVTAATATIDPSIEPQQKALCDECKANPSKYKCPACSTCTCCLTCVKSHKQRTSCTGKRDQTQFIPLSQFNDNVLLSDYNLLEGIKRVAESAQRKRVKLCGHHPQFSLPFFLKGLRHAAARQNITLLFLPNGMLKREKNKTRYDRRKKSIFWTIEWRFYSTDVVLLDNGVHEDATLRLVLGKHLEPSPWRNKLREFCDAQLDNLKLFIRKYPRGPRSPFRELDINASVSRQLADLAIVEYPVIHVFLPSHACDFEVVKDLKPLLHERNLKQPTKDDYPSQEGVLFEEEEIQDDGSGPDTQVLDLSMSSEPDARPPPNCHRVQNAGRELNNESSDKSETAHRAENDLNMCSNEQRVLGAETEFFDFDPDLMDVYSYLNEGSNPDDLDFNWDGMDNPCQNNETDREDLEEGEIREST